MDPNFEGVCVWASILSGAETDACGALVNSARCAFVEGVSGGCTSCDGTFDSESGPYYRIESGEVEVLTFDGSLCGKASKPGWTPCSQNAPTPPEACNCAC